MPDTNLTASVQEPVVEKTFTQQEVDDIVTKRLARAMKGMPSGEELANYNKWKAEQPQATERFNTLTAEKDTLTTKLAEATEKLNSYERERYVFSKGLSGEDAEFVAFKAAKLVTQDKTFEQAVDEILENRGANVVIKTGGALGGGDSPKSASDMFNALIRSARK